MKLGQDARVHFKSIYDYTVYGYVRPMAIHGHQFTITKKSLPPILKDICTPGHWI